MLKILCLCLQNTVKLINFAVLPLSQLTSASSAESNPLDGNSPLVFRFRTSSNSSFEAAVGSFGITASSPSASKNACVFPSLSSFSRKKQAAQKVKFSSTKTPLVLRHFSEKTPRRSHQRRLSWKNSGFPKVGACSREEGGSIFTCGEERGRRRQMFMSGSTRISESPGRRPNFVHYRGRCVSKVGIFRKKPCPIHAAFPDWSHGARKQSKPPPKHGRTLGWFLGWGGDVKGEVSRMSGDALKFPRNFAVLQGILTIPVTLSRNWSQRKTPEGKFGVQILKLTWKEHEKTVSLTQIFWVFTLGTVILNFSWEMHHAIRKFRIFLVAKQTTTHYYPNIIPRRNWSVRILIG